MRTKLTADQVASIRERYAAGGVTQQTLAAEHGVTQMLISLIVRGKLWQSQPVCGVCGEPFVRERPAQKFCSAACVAVQHHRRDQAAYRARNPLPEDRRCLCCFSLIPETRRAGSVYCSLDCYRLVTFAKPRATIPLEIPGAPPTMVGRDYIIERDGGRCHICGEECDPQAAQYDPKRIHLDHLIPLAHGGVHTASNIRVACAGCNWSKNAHGAGDQLLLFG